MLPVHIERLLREQIETDLRTKGTKRRDLEQRAAHKAMQGRMHRPGVQALEILEEIGRRANLITEAIRKVLLNDSINQHCCCG
jgi:hypothetical protein